MKAKTIAIAALAALSLSACGGTSGPEWDKVPTDGNALKSYIDESAASKDCELLQDAFDTWAEYKTPDGLHLTGVMEYIDTAMKDAGCY